MISKDRILQNFRDLRKSPRGMGFAVTRRAMEELELSEAWLQSQCKRFGVYGTMDLLTDTFIVTNDPPSNEYVTKAFGY